MKTALDARNTKGRLGKSAVGAVPSQEISMGLISKFRRFSQMKTARPNLGSGAGRIRFPGSHSVMQIIPFCSVNCKRFIAGRIRSKTFRLAALESVKLVRRPAERAKNTEGVKFRPIFPRPGLATGRHKGTEGVRAHPRCGEGLNARRRNAIL